MHMACQVEQMAVVLLLNTLGIFAAAGLSAASVERHKKIVSV
jgi:hypothetical protein